MDVSGITNGKDLIALIQGGGTVTFTKFYTLYFEKLLLTSDRYLGDIQSAEEVV